MFISTLKRYCGIITYRTIAGIKSEARQNYLGYLWFLLEPLLSTAVLYVAFTQITGKNGTHVVMSILIGMIIWQWFESSCMLGSTAIKTKYGVLNQYDLPKYIFPIVTILVNTWKFFCVFLVILLVTTVLGYPPNRHFIHLPYLILLQLLLILGVTLPLSIGATLMNDLLTVVSSIFRLFFFLSGIFFEPNVVPEHLHSWFFANPMAVFIDSYRDVILRNQMPDFSHLTWAMSISGAFLLVGFSLHLYYDKKILKLTNV